MKTTQFNPWSQKQVQIKSQNPQEDYGLFQTQIAPNFVNTPIMKQKVQEKEHFDLNEILEQNVSLCEENTQKKLQLIQTIQDQKYRQVINPEIFRENIELMEKLNKICYEVSQVYESLDKMIGHLSQNKIKEQIVQIEIPQENRELFLKLIQDKCEGKSLLNLENIEGILKSLGQKLEKLEQICYNEIKSTQNLHH